MLEKYVIENKKQIWIFLLSLILLLSLLLNFARKFPPFVSLGLEFSNTDDITIDGDASDWKRAYLKIVDGDILKKGEDVHIMAMSYYEGMKKLYFGVFYPNWERWDTDLIVALDIQPGGASGFQDLPFVTTSLYELVIRINHKGEARVFDHIGRALPSSSVKVGIDDFSGLIEFSLEKETAEKYGFSLGKPLRVQVLSVKGKRILDTVPNAVKTIMKGTVPFLVLGKSINTAYASPGVKLAIIHHGNQAVNNNTDTLLSENGGANGYNPILKVHFDTGVKVNFHISATTLIGIRWNSMQAWPALGNRTFLQALHDGFNSGLFGIVGSTASQLIMPYSYKAENKFMLLYENEIFQYHWNKTPIVAWVPERTWVNDPNIQWHSGGNNPCGGSGPNNNVKDKTMAETFSSCGFKAVLLDGNQHHNWFHTPDPMGQNDNAVPHKILDPSTGQFSGVIAIWNNRDIQDHLCCGDQSCWDGLTGTMNWVATFGEGAIGIYGDDLEKAAGYSSTWPDFLTQGYITMINRLKNQSWIEPVNINDFMSWFSYCYDGVGTPSYPNTQEYPNINVPFGTYENPVVWLGGGDYYQCWDNHASDPAMFKTDPRSYRQMMIDAHNAILSAENYTWQDWQNNNLIKLARIILGTTTYEWMWHDDANNISDWNEKMVSHTKNAMYYAEAAKWAYSPSAYGARVQAVDVDLDERTEYIIQNDKIMAVLEPDGGRVQAMFVRDPTTGQGFCVIGNEVAQYYQCGGDWPNLLGNHIDWVEPDHLGALLYHQAEVNDGLFYDNHQSTGNPYGDPAQFPDRTYSVETTADSITFKDANPENQWPDGSVVKRITLTGNNNYFNVEMYINTPPELTEWPGKKRVICQLNPDYLNILKNGKDAIADYTFTDGANSGYGVKNADDTVRVWVSVPSGTTVTKSYKLLTREYILTHSDAGNPLVFKLGADKVLPDVGSIIGNVKSTSNTNIAGALVAVEGTSLSGSSGINGSYAVNNVPVGTYRVTCSKSGFLPVTRSNISVLKDQQTGVNFQLPLKMDFGRISGKITVTNTSQGINSANVFLIKSSVTNYIGVSDFSGNYYITNVQVGTYNLKVMKSGYYVKDLFNITIVTNPPKVLNVDLVPIPQPPGAVSGKVTMEGIPNYTSTTLFVQNALNTYRTGNFNGDGSYVMNNVAVGDYTVFARKTGYMMSYTNATVYSLQNTIVNLYLRKITLVGDFNQDGVVDELDYNLLMQVFANPLHPQYFQCDANQDGIVDGRDLVLWAANYGKRAF